MNRKHVLVAFIFFFFFWFGFLFLSGSLTSGFHFTDDHQIIIYNETLESAGAIETALGWIGQDVRTIGRFLPVYYIHRLLQIKFFGADFLVWGLYDGLLAWLSSSFMAAFMLVLGFTLFEALLFPCLLFLGFQTGIWWRFGTAETIGMLVLSVMLLSAAVSAKKKSRSLDLLFTVSGVVLMLTKETFILFIPALVFLKVWLTGKELRSGWFAALKAEAAPSAVLLFLAGAEVVFIKFFVGTTGIGYAGYEGFSAAPLVASFVNYLFASQAWLVPMGLAFALAVCGREKKPWADLAAVLVLLALSLVPQAALHAKSGVSERYILPGIFGVVFASVYFLKLTRQGLGKARPGLRAGPVAAWAIALSLVVLGAFMLGHRKLAITFNLADLTMLSEVDEVPYLAFVTSWAHAATRQSFLWIASGVLILCALASKSASAARYLNQRTFFGFLLLWAALFGLTVGSDNAFLSGFQGKKTNEWLASIEANTGRGDAIVVVADPAMNNEWALSIKRYLTVLSGRENLYAYPVLTKPAYTPFEQTLIASFPTIYPGRVISGAPGPSVAVKAVVIFPNAEDAFLASSAAWFDPAYYRKYVNMYGFVSYYLR